MAHIQSITYQTAPSENKEPYHFNRTPIDQVQLIENFGIEGDIKARRNTKRQLNIMGAEMVETLKSEGYQTNPGQLGEQIVIHGLDVMALAKGTRLQIGESAIVEITKPRTPCEWFELIQSKTIKETTNRIGMMACVIESGPICVNDPVVVLETIIG